MIQFLPLGGAGEIGSSCFYLNIDGTGIILDCGMHPRKNVQEALPMLEHLNDKDVDFCIISHAHQDHIGALPYLVRKHPYIKLFSTPQTRAIAELTLHNSVSILSDKLKENDLLKPYSHDEIDLLIQSINYKSYNEEFELRGMRSNSSLPVKVSLQDAGHILGSAGILLEHNGHKIFYTGDINMDDQMLTPKAVLPNKKIDTLIIECTYGATDSASLPGWTQEAKKMASDANKILEAGGSVLIPVFSLGKLQEMLTTIWTMMQKGLLIKTDIYTGGIGRKINILHDRNRYVVRRTDKDFELAEIPYKDIYEVDNISLFRRNPSIILAPSGMVIEGTLSFNLALDWLRQDKFAIFIVGYMDPDTPGYLIASSEKGQKLSLPGLLSTLEIKCSIERYRFSSHAKRDGLLEIVKRLRPEKVILVHGDEPSIDWMGYNILEKNPGIKVYAAETGHKIEL